VSLKIDHSFNPNNNLAVRYIYGKTLEENAGGVGVGGLIDVSGGGGSMGQDQSLFVSWTPDLRVVDVQRDAPSSPRATCSSTPTTPWGPGSRSPAWPPSAATSTSRCC
jgi:hypothetical protein